jgi:hypothetical protein
MAATRTGCDVMEAKRLVYGMSAEKRRCGERLSDSNRMTKDTGWRDWSADMGSMCGTILRGQCGSG